MRTQLQPMVSVLGVVCEDRISLVQRSTGKWNTSLKVMSCRRGGAFFPVTSAGMAWRRLAQRSSTACIWVVLPAMMMLDNRLMFGYRSAYGVRTRTRCIATVTLGRQCPPSAWNRVRHRVEYAAKVRIRAKKTVLALPGDQPTVGLPQSTRSPSWKTPQTTNNTPPGTGA